MNRKIARIGLALLLTVGLVFSLVAGTGQSGLMQQFFTPGTLEIDLVAGAGASTDVYVAGITTSDEILGIYEFALTTAGTKALIKNWTDSTYTYTLVPDTSALSASGDSVITYTMTQSTIAMTAIADSSWTYTVTPSYTDRTSTLYNVETDSVALNTSTTGDKLLIFWFDVDG